MIGKIYRIRDRSERGATQRKIGEGEERERKRDIQTERDKQGEIQTKRVREESERDREKERERQRERNKEVMQYIQFQYIYSPIIFPIRPVYNFLTLLQGP